MKYIGKHIFVYAVFTALMTPFFVYAQTTISGIPGTTLLSAEGDCARREAEIDAKYPDPVLDLVNRTKAKYEIQKKCYQFLEPLPVIDENGKEAEATAISIEPTGSIGKSFNNFYDVAIALGSVLAVIMITLYGFRYMTGEKGGYDKQKLKDKITNTVLGILLLLGIYVILNTINPQLLEVDPQVGEISIVASRIDDPQWVANIESIDTTGIVFNENITSQDVFLIYLTHQQGAGGASAIIKAAKSGTSVSGKITRNMKSNFPAKDVTKVLGGSTVLTPNTFLKYWGIKVAAVQKNPPQVSGTINTALTFASQKTGLSYDTMRVMCKIESGCLDKNITIVNKFGYSGLFQLSNEVFDKYKGYFTRPSILDPAQNAYAAGMYGLDNLKSIKKKL